MPQHGNLPVPFRGDPVELDDPPLAHEGFVPMPGIVCTLERYQSSLDGWHLNEDIIEITA